MGRMIDLNDGDGENEDGKDGDGGEDSEDDDDGENADDGDDSEEDGDGDVDVQLFDFYANLLQQEDLQGDEAAPKLAPPVGLEISLPW